MRVGSECARLGGQNSALKLNNLSLDFRHTLQLKEAVCDVASSLEATNSTLDKSHINHIISPLIHYE